MMNKLFRAAAIPLVMSSLMLMTGCAASPEDGDPSKVVTQSLTRYIVFVAYFDDAAHSNLVGAATFSACPGDPSYSWGAQTSFYTIESEPCG